MEPPPPVCLQCSLKPPSHYLQGAFAGFRAIQRLKEYATCLHRKAAKDLQASFSHARAGGYWEKRINLPVSSPDEYRYCGHACFWQAVYSGKDQYTVMWKYDTPLSGVIITQWVFQARPGEELQNFQRSAMDYIDVRVRLPPPPLRLIGSS